MFFTNDRVLINETKERVDNKFKWWRDTLETKGFQVKEVKE